MLIKMIVKIAWFKMKNKWPAYVTRQCTVFAVCGGEWALVEQRCSDNRGLWNVLLLLSDPAVEIQDYLLGTRDFPCLPAAKWYFWTERWLPRGWLKRVCKHRARIQKLSSQNSGRYFPSNVFIKRNRRWFSGGWIVRFLKEQTTGA